MNIKKLFLTTLFTTSVLCLHAQKKGDFSLGLSAGISYTDATALSKTTNRGSTGMNSVYTFGVSALPEIGYFIVNNLKISLSGGYALQSERKEGTYGGVNPKTSTGVFAVGPSFSYYLKVARGLYFTPEIGAFYAFGTTNQRDISLIFSGSAGDPQTCLPWNTNLQTESALLFPSAKLNMSPCREMPKKKISVLIVRRLASE